MARKTLGTPTGDPPWTAPLNFSSSLSLLAAGGLFVALREPWCEIHYEHQGLCEVNKKVCNFIGRFALSSLCLDTPAEDTCADRTIVPASILGSTHGVRHCGWHARTLSVVALSLHVPVVFGFCLLLFVRQCADNVRVRRFILRFSVFLALVSAIIILVALLTFGLKAVPCYTEFVCKQVDHIYGKNALKKNDISKRILIGPILEIVAVAFDAISVCLMCSAGMSVQPITSAFGQEEMTLPINEAHCPKSRYDIVGKMWASQIVTVLRHLPSITA